MDNKLISVSQLNRYVHSLLDGDPALKYIFVVGEISNLKINSVSKHAYFTLKDEGAAVRAVMFRSYAERLKFIPKEGMKVICSASVTVYERDGQYQLNVTDMQPDGAGSLAVAFEQLKQKLAAEGLFDASRKRPIPEYPMRIAVISSDTGAAIHDMISVLGRRWPIATIVFCPASVQGSGAALSLTKALRYVDKTADCDLVIIGRGGGSAEDLWCFNDEMLARTVAAMKTPVISAVGHETDFTICDFAADLRAPTPSAAAELAVPDIPEVADAVKTLKRIADNRINAQIEYYAEKLDGLMSRSPFAKPMSVVEMREMRLDGLLGRIDSAFSEYRSSAENRLMASVSKLDALNPAKILKRGYAFAEEGGKTVKSVREIKPGDIIKLHFSDGTAECSAISTKENA